MLLKSRMRGTGPRIPSDATEYYLSRHTTDHARRGGRDTDDLLTNMLQKTCTRGGVTEVCRNYQGGASLTF